MTAIHCIRTTDDYGRPAYKATHKVLNGLDMRTHTAVRPTASEAIARAYQMATCAHDFAVSLAMRTRKCRKCPHVEYIR